MLVDHEYEASYLNQSRLVQPTQSRVLTDISVEWGIS